ncbi:DUF1249 domain-containing protein [Colwellia psychrerythraea]|uniref:Dehydrogenase n=1 Tax=Colwellia psychrerythraea TaxID=28229 RepID=A0A099L0Y5_COLPS|nr:DUF1249 domain-containing protein [Colwellia psychrerythraea]KGJ95538.1 protein of unknown function DUF1249 [Colwellia psychrerythraea]
MSFFPKKRLNNADRKSYQPNLVSLMTLCANNYMLLQKILACKSALGEIRNFFISDFLSYSVTIKEVTRYTTVISFEQDSLSLSFKNIPGIVATALHPRMTIRLYHDARMAEVLATQDIRQVKPRYDYPNSQMHQQDEKQQINQFLNEWLHLCLRLGQVNVELHS